MLLFQPCEWNWMKDKALTIFISLPVSWVIPFIEPACTTPWQRIQVKINDKWTKGEIIVDGKEVTNE